MARRRRYELTDEQFERIEDALPEVNGRGRPYEETGSSGFFAPEPPGETYQSGMVRGGRATIDFNDGPAWTDKRTAEALEVAEGTVQSLRERFCKRELKGTVERKSPDREYDKKLDGEQEARLIRLACSEAPEGRSDWSLRLLADRLVELGVVDSISHEAVRQTLKKTS